MGDTREFTIIGDWRDGDSTRNCLQVADTDARTPSGEPIKAVRSSYAPSHVAYFPAGQLRNAAQIMPTLLGGSNLP